MKKLMIPMIALTLATSPAYAKSASNDFSWSEVRQYFSLLLPAVQRFR